MASLKTIHLTTIGRRSGKPHTKPMYCFEHEGKYVVTASAGGKDTHPDWFLNLKANSNIVASLGKWEFNARAHVTSPALRKKLWAQLIKLSPHYAAYQKKTKRVIPMVLLVPEQVK